MTRIKFWKTEAKDENKIKKRMKARKKKVMSRKDRKKLQLEEDKNNTISKNYEEYQPLHDLWESYINDFLGDNCSKNNAPARMVKADFHGALITGKNCTINLSVLKLFLFTLN